MNRRHFLSGLAGGLVVAPLAPWTADARNGATLPPVLIGATWRGPATDSEYRMGMLVVDWERRALDVRWSVALPTRAHGLLAESDGSLLAVAVRPGRWLLRVDPDGRVARRFMIDDEAGGRRFNGHVVASPDGAWLYATETDVASGAGWITARDCATFAKVAEWPSEGIEPHDLVVDGHGHLVVANGGILRTAEDRKRDLDRMDSSLVRLDGRSGEVLGHWRVPDRRLSLRHLAWSPQPDSDQRLLGIAMQAEHDDPARRAEAPALAIWDGQTVSIPSYAVDADGYAGDIAAAADGGFVISSHEVDRALWWRPRSPGRFTLIAELQRAYALSPWSTPGKSGGVIIAAARGMGLWHPAWPPATLPWPEPMVLDNHWVAMRAQELASS
jgi:hypothetical protein